MPTRRHFLLASAAGAASLAVRAAEPPPVKLKKAVKFGMVAGKASIADKFALLKKLGFEGVEIDAPTTLSRPELRSARDKFGVQIHGVVCSTHWAKPLSDPAAEVRAVTAKAFADCLRQAEALGGDTALVVPGVVKKGVGYEECWDRSTAELKKLVPVAEETGVRIAVEVVWNNFITKPDQLVKFVDQFNTPLVGAYFDASNMLKYGVPAADWVRALGKRMLKLDFKGYSVAKAKAAKDEWKGFDVGIGDGDEDWPAVLKACAEVGYTSWATAEVKGGNEAWLRDVSERMDRILGR